MSQLDMFASAPRPEPRLPSPEDVRPELTEVLGRLRGEGAPLTPKELRFWRTVFPQMSRWLLDDERTAMRQAFDDELARLETRRAA